jgi:ABC-type transport system involved in multi-copper enzyme maturation permease subunit
MTTPAPRGPRADGGGSLGVPGEARAGGPGGAARSAPRGGQAQLARLVRVEWLKLASTRLTYGLLATSVGLTALWNTLEASRAGTASGPDPLNTVAGLRSIVTGGVWDLILAGVLGMLISSGEFRHHTATSTYLAAPGRNRVLAAKAIAGAGGGALFGLAGYAVACAVGLSFTAAHGYPVSIGAATFADWGAGHLVGGALLGVIGVAIGSLVRSQLAVVIGAFVWPIILESLIGALFPAVHPYLPYTAATTLAGTPLGVASFGAGRGGGAVSPLPFATATALLLAIGAVVALIAARTTVRRDVT